MRLDKIKANPSNPRVIRDDKFNKLVKSLQGFPEMMDKRPIVVDETMTVLGGNMRLRALQHIYGKGGDIPDAWVVVAEGWTEEQKREFVIKDNAAFGEWDWDALANEWGTEDLADWGLDIPEDTTKILPAEAVEDDFDETKDTVETVCKKGDIWKLGNHRLMCGDSTDSGSVALLMEGERADMCFTDPPYGMNLDTDYTKMEGNGRKGKKYERVIGDNEDFSPKLISTVFDNFGYCNEIFLWGVDYYFDLIPNFKDGSLIVWDKTLQTNGDAGYNSEFELCWTKTPHKKEVIHFNWFRYFGLSLQDIKTREHPTQKPLQVILPYIEKYSNEKGFVVDIYGGSGSTLIACEQLNRKCRMMELDPHYCDVIIARWEKFTGRKAERVTQGMDV